KLPRSEGKKKFDSNITRTLDEAARRICLDNASNVLVVGDRAFADQARAVLGERMGGWASSVIDDVFMEAAILDAGALEGRGAILCGGPDVATNYRLAVTRLVDLDPSVPVHWVAEDWEFCAGTLPVPSQADDAVTLLYNHFKNYFGIKDAI